MKIGKKLGLICTLIAALSQMTFMAPARAQDETPKIELVTPSVGTKIMLDAPIELTLRITGGFAANANDCNMPQGSSSRYVGLIAQIEDENGQFLYWRRSDSGFESFLFFNSAKPRIIPNGVECTIIFNPPNNKNWLPIFYSNVEKRNLVDKNQMDEFVFGNVQKIKFTWFMEGSRNAEGLNLSSIGDATFAASPGVKPSLTFVDIARGDVVNNKKTFKMILEIKKELKIVNFDSTESCTKPKLELTLNNLDRYVVNCETRVGLLTRRTTSQGTYAISAVATLSNNEVVSSNNLILNIGKTEQPIVSLTVYGLENGSGYRIKASGQMYLAKDGNINEAVPNQEYSFCVAGICKIGQSDARGEILMYIDFSPSELKRLQENSYKVNWTFAATHEGSAFLSSKDISNYNSSDGRFYNELIVGTDELPEEKVKEVKSAIGFTSLSSQNKVTWGNYISIKYIAVGKGRVLCAAYYQPTATQGIFTFYVTGGKSGTIKFKPWFYKLASYPLQVACAARPGGGLNVGDPRDVYSLGNVTITK